MMIQITSSNLNARNIKAFCYYPEVFTVTKSARLLKMTISIYIGGR